MLYNDDFRHKLIVLVVKKVKVILIVAMGGLDSGGADFVPY